MISPYIVDKCHQIKGLLFELRREAIYDAKILFLLPLFLNGILYPSKDLSILDCE